MSERPEGGLDRPPPHVPAWVRFGLVAGFIAFAVTLLANLLVLILRPADLCRLGPGIIALSSLAAFGAFLLLAAVAGLLTGRATGSAAQAALSGLVMATISGCALLVLIPFLSNASQRFQELGARCPETSSFTSGGSFSFGFGPSPPPGFTAPTPPPGFIPTPPPGFVTPPPGAFTPPAGAVGVIFEAIGLVITIGIGMALATGVATLGGSVGAATRPEPS